MLSPKIRNSSLFFLDIELTFRTNPPGLIFDVMGPFTKDANSLGVNSTDILETGIGWIYSMCCLVYHAAINILILARITF
ncbi:hypothetical protein RCL_jg5604.t1 [Rhizophagus clarus]|uniref:Uncharacterized protein n=1 Tax=Rhizophagus clarus TaxID=94130 RepID=A0A8H3M4S9_9GLOM|nr:hypothetical protein RCL_jg5604.t1 [Rhizophagus clarus]